MFKFTSLPSMNEETIIYSCIHGSFIHSCIEECTEVIRNKKDIQALRHLIIELPMRKWCACVNQFGNTLLQESILADNKEAFDFLLPLHDSESLDECNALIVTLDTANEELELREYFIIQLTKSGAHIDVFDDDETLLDKALDLSSTKIVELLLDLGINVNYQCKNGNTYLHKVLVNNSVDDLVSLLLFHSADPFISNNDGYLPFEYAVKFKDTLLVQEILFNYTFDEHTYCEIDIEVVLLLARRNSEIFHKILNHDQVIIVQKNLITKPIDIFDSLFTIDVECLKRLIEKCDYLIKDLLEEITDLTKSSIFAGHRCLTYIKNIIHLNVLFESSVKPCMITLLSSLRPKRIFIDAVINNNEADVLKLLIFLLSYGLYFSKAEYEEVYLTYGYCELFKLMLFIGSCDTYSDGGYIRSPMCRFISDINFVFKDLFALRSRFVHLGISVEVLDYFANVRLTNYLREISAKPLFLMVQLTRRMPKQYEDLRTTLLAKIAKQPRVPLLVELSRNVFREYLIEKFDVRNESQFYSIVHWLPISKVYKKIITYETKLY